MDKNDLGIKYVNININPKHKFNNEIITKSKKNIKKFDVEDDVKSQDYIKPTLTYTEKLSKKDIEDMLIDYERVNDLTTIKLGSHVRYFETSENDDIKFRIGGNVIFIKLPDYIMLGNGNVKWSVQIKKSVFFKRIDILTLREEFKYEISLKDKEINELSILIRDLKKNNNLLLKENTKLQTQLKKVIKNL